MQRNRDRLHQRRRLASSPLRNRSLLNSRDTRRIGRLSCRTARNAGLKESAERRPRRHLSTSRADRRRSIHRSALLDRHSRSSFYKAHIGQKVVRGQRLSSLRCYSCREWMARPGRVENVHCDNTAPTRIRIRRGRHVPARHCISMRHLEAMLRNRQPRRGQSEKSSLAPRAG